jgi:SP family sugar:H+ symporter-like MFS transporter
MKHHICTDGKDEGNVISGLQAFPAWQEDLNYPTGARLGALNACGQIAGLVVGPVIAYIDEHYGRKWGIRCEYFRSHSFLPC